MPGVGGLSSNFYTVAIRLTPNQVLDSEPVFHQQSARTSGSISNSSSEVELVNWNEIFFFKVDSQVWKKIYVFTNCLRFETSFFPSMHYWKSDELLKGILWTPFSTVLAQVSWGEHLTIKRWQFSFLYFIPLKESY